MEHFAADNAHGLKSYFAGFVLALILTAIPFALVATNSLPQSITLIIIGVAAISRS